MSFPTDQEDPGSIRGIAIECFSSEELFHGIYGLGVSVFHCPLSMFCHLLGI